MLDTRREDSWGQGLQLSYFFKYKVLESLIEKERTEELTLEEWVLVVLLRKEVYD